MKEIILYNLKDSVSDEEYKAYTHKKKGPFLNGLPSCKTGFKLIKIVASETGEIPYKYVGIYDATSTEDLQKDVQTKPYQEFIQEWGSKVKESYHILMGEEVFGD